MSAISHNLHRACAHTLKTAVLRQSTTSSSTSLIARSSSPNANAVASFSTTSSRLVGYQRPFRCLRCDQPGHRASECTQPKRCYNCGQPGHDARNCDKPTKCYRCGNFGHSMGQCPEKHSIPHCSLCGEQHEARACPHHGNAPA